METGADRAGPPDPEAVHGWPPPGTAFPSYLPDTYPLDDDLADLAEVLRAEQEKCRQLELMQERLLAVAGTGAAHAAPGQRPSGDGGWGSDPEADSLSTPPTASASATAPGTPTGPARRSSARRTSSKGAGGPGRLRPAAAHSRGAARSATPRSRPAAGAGAGASRAAARSATAAAPPPRRAVHSPRRRSPQPAPAAASVPRRFSGGAPAGAGRPAGAATRAQLAASAAAAQLEPAWERRECAAAGAPQPARVPPWLSPPRAAPGGRQRLYLSPPRSRQHSDPTAAQYREVAARQAADEERPAPPAPPAPSGSRRGSAEAKGTAQSGEAPPTPASSAATRRRPSLAAHEVTVLHRRSSKGHLERQEEIAQLRALLAACRTEAALADAEAAGRTAVAAQEAGEWQTRAARLLVQQAESRARDEVEEHWGDTARLLGERARQHLHHSGALSKILLQHDLEFKDSVLKRALAVMSLYHLDSQRRVLAAEGAARQHLTRMAALSHKTAELAEFLKRDEGECRQLVRYGEETERRGLLTVAAGEAAWRRALPGSRRQAELDEKRARFELRLCEGSLRQTLFHTATREKRWGLVREQQEAMRRLAHDEAAGRTWLCQLRVHDMWLRMATKERMLRLQLRERRYRWNVAEEETRGLLGLKADSLPPWARLTELEHGKRFAQHEESVRRSVLQEGWERHVAVLEMEWDRDTSSLMSFIFARSQLPLSEERYRMHLREEQRSARYLLYSHSIEVSHLGVRAQLAEEAAYGRMVLTKQWQLMVAVVCEHEHAREQVEHAEQRRRGAVAAAEQAAREEVADLHRLFMQRFSAEHAKRMLSATQQRDRRQIEWDEVALRNAVLQCRIDRLRGAAAERFATEGVRRAIEREQGFSPLPLAASRSPSPAAPAAPPRPAPSASPGRTCSPSPVVPVYSNREPSAPPQYPDRHPDQYAELGELVGRLSEVRNRLREHVSSCVSEERRNQQEGEAGALRMLRLLWQRYDADGAGALPPPVPVAEQWGGFKEKVEQILRSGALSVDDEVLLERMATDMCHALGERGGEAAGRLGRVQAFLRLLSSLRILRRD